MLGEIEAGGPARRVVLADMEAGLGALTRLEGGHVDCLLVVAEPTPKALEVARRAVALARERGVGRVLVLANRVRDAQGLEMVRGVFPEEEILVIPEDRAIEDADREGVAPIDAAPDAPGVRALAAVARRLVREAAG